MRTLLFRLIYLLCRAMRPRWKRLLQPLGAGSTVLYAQFERPLGCCVHGTPLVQAIHAAAPGVKVIVATQGPGAATLRHHPGIDRLIEIESNPVGSFGNVRSAAGELRARLAELKIAPDVVVQDASSRRSASALFAALLRLAPTVGFGDAPALYDRFLSYDPGLSLIDNNLRIVGALGSRPRHLEPAVFFDSTELARARELLRGIRSEGAGVIGFVLQGSGGQRTGWHPERFADVIAEMERRGFASVFLGTAGDQEGIEAVQALANSRGLSLAGRTSISEAAAVLALCDLLITVDTGTMHLGRSVSVPMVVLGPSWQRPLEWLPLGVENVRILRGPDRDDVPPGYQLDEIGVGDVLNAADELLRRYPPSLQAREDRAQQRLGGKVA